LIFLVVLCLVVTAAILIPVLTTGSPGSPTAKTLANDRELAAVAARTLQHNLVIYSQSRRGNETTWLTTLMLFDHDGDFAMYLLPATKKRAANGSVPRVAVGSLPDEIQVGCTIYQRASRDKYWKEPDSQAELFPMILLTSLRQYASGNQNGVVTVRASIPGGEVFSSAVHYTYSQSYDSSNPSSTFITATVKEGALREIEEEAPAGSGKSPAPAARLQLLLGILGHFTVHAPPRTSISKVLEGGGATSVACRTS
jgi:hypothetical protein